MSIERENLASISDVFGILGLESKEDRERFRLLAELGSVGLKPKCCFHEQAKTRNNTAKDEEYAELEPTP